MTTLDVAAPIEPLTTPVGRRTITLVDMARDQRRLDVDVWYPAVTSDAPRSVYEVFPGVAFRSPWAQHEAPVAAGTFPLVMMSHGRTGMRISYSQWCEAMASRGAIVVSADHPGDALVDWLTARHVDDRTNETNRVADAHLVLGALLHGHDAVPADIRAAVSAEHVALAGHSYGAYTAFATAAGARGVDAHEHVGAVIGFQPFMRTMSDRLLGRVDVPALLVVSEQDQVTPAHIDADRAWQLLPGRPAWRLDIAGVGHQAISDIALYAELADQLPDLPELVRNYLAATAAGTSGPGRPSWRTVMSHEVDVAWAFLQVALGIDPVGGRGTAAALATVDGLRLEMR